MMKEDTADSMSAQLIAGYLDTRVIPEAEAINGGTINDVRRVIVRIVLQFLCTRDTGELTQWAASLLSHWYREEPSWKSCFESTLKALVRFVINKTWKSLIHHLRLLKVNGQPF
jgi:hypothetical protein